MGKTTPSQRVFLGTRYKQMFDKDLTNVIKKECGKRAFGKALQYLAAPSDAAEAEMLHDACKGYVQ